MARRHLLPALSLLATLALASNAFAQSSVLVAPANSAEIQDIRVAIATGSNHSTLWFSARLEGAPDDLFLVVPAPPSSKIDLASDAWFEALAQATDPRITPPSTAPSCGSTPAASTFELIGTDAHTKSIAPQSDVQVLSLSGLYNFISSEGLAFQDSELASLVALDSSGYSFITLRFSPGAGEFLTQTVRVTSPQPTAKLPMLLTHTGGTKSTVTAWFIAEGKAFPSSADLLGVDASKLRWDMSKNLPSHSNYLELRDQLLNKNTWAFILESANRQSIFRSSSVQNGFGSIPSVAESYYERASAYANTSVVPENCTIKVAALEFSTLVVDQACAKGEIASLPPLVACSNLSQSQSTNPKEIDCGGFHDDLALAFAGLHPANTWLTRWYGVIPAWSSRKTEPFLTMLNATERSPTLKSQDYSNLACGSDAGTGGSAGSSQGGTGGKSGSSGSSGASGSSSGSSGSSSQPGGSGSYPPSGSAGDSNSDDSNYSSDNSVYVESGCNGSNAGAFDSCSGSTESSSSSSGDSCSGDSSSGDSCSGSSSSGGDSCSSSSGSSSSSGCSSSSGSSSSNCSVSRGRSRRPPTSAVTLLFLTFVYPIRRMTKSRK